MEKLKGLMECRVYMSVPVEVPASQHQDECDHMIVMRFGIEDHCEEFLPFCEVDGGAGIRNCPGVIYESQNKDQSFRISLEEGEKPGKEDCLMWKTRIFQSYGRKFFVTGGGLRRTSVLGNLDVGEFQGV